MTKEEIIEELRDLLYPERQDPYWGDNPNWYHLKIKDILERIMQDEQDE